MRRAVSVLCCALVLWCGLPLLAGCSTGSVSTQSVRIAVPYTPTIRRIATNYYKQWLEEQTGLSIEFVEINQVSAEAYLRAAFSSGNNTFDAVFLPGDGSEWVSGRALDEFGRQGWLLPLEGYIDEVGANTRALFGSFDAYDLRQAITASDGHIYAMPSIRLTTKSQSAQTFWINVEWLKALGLTVPQTTDELAAVLTAFAMGDPNGNGEADELPLIGCEDDMTLHTLGFLMGSFVYNDPFNARMAVAGGEVFYAPASSAWRTGLAWLAQLYGQGLVPELNFGYTAQQIVQLANDPRDLVGCFTAGSVNDVLLQNSPELISRFIHVAPLSSSEGRGLATVETPHPRAAGVVTTQCQDPQQVFALMDLMLGSEASRIAWYGEEDVDWQYAQHGQLSLYSDAATIRVLNVLNGKVQNKTLAQLGPGALSAADADGVTWSGFEVDQEYIDARADASYRNYYPKEYLSAILFPPEDADGLEAIRTAVEAYTMEMMSAFVSGEKDVGSDGEWAAYLRHLDALGIGRLVDAVQNGGTIRMWA